jgi:hypothetical protein
MRVRIPREELNASIASHHDLHRPIATGHESLPIDKMRREAVAAPSSRCSRLKDDRGIRGCDQRHDRLAPASVMRQLEEVAAEID